MYVIQPHGLQVSAWLIVDCDCMACRFLTHLNPTCLKHLFTACIKHLLLDVHGQCIYFCMVDDRFSPYVLAECWTVAADRRFQLLPLIDALRRAAGLPAMMGDQPVPWQMPARMGARAARAALPSVPGQPPNSPRRRTASETESRGVSSTQRGLRRTSCMQLNVGRLPVVAAHGEVPCPRHAVCLTVQQQRLQLQQLQQLQRMHRVYDRLFPAAVGDAHSNASTSSDDRYRRSSAMAGPNGSSIAASTRNGRAPTPNAASAAGTVRHRGVSEQPLTMHEDRAAAQLEDVQSDSLMALSFSGSLGPRRPTLRVPDSTSPASGDHGSERAARRGASSRPPHRVRRGRPQLRVLGRPQSPPPRPLALPPMPPAQFVSSAAGPDGTPMQVCRQ